MLAAEEECVTLTMYAQKLINGRNSIYGSLYLALD